MEHAAERFGSQADVDERLVEAADRRPVHFVVLAVFLGRSSALEPGRLHDLRQLFPFRCRRVWHLEGVDH